jgi:type IV pilus modification protein PilV
MNVQKISFRIQAKPRRAAGATLLDVLLAIGIFVIGMLALASMQGNLTRSSVDANSRTMATNIAEELIEQLRTFEQFESETGKDAYQDIVDQSLTVTRGGIDYSVDITVENFFFLDGTTVTSNLDDLSEDRDVSIPDFKYVELAVSWAGNEFQLNDGAGTTTSGRLGSGDFVVSTVVPAISSYSSAKVVAMDDDSAGTPPVFYTPGVNPETVAIDIGNSKFKESTTPEPVVWRSGELIETWFDVITYNRVGGDAIFVRREEFASVSCKCTMQASGNVGRGPTIWDGSEYLEGEVVNKPYGTLAASAGKQSQYCEVCCRLLP